MEGLVEQWARQIGWRISERNVIVEGTSDVAILTHARDLWLARTKRDLFGGGFAVVAAGVRNDGGVAGVVRRLNAVRQFAEADAAALGRERHRFIGLLDNDYAGRGHLKMACEIDRRVIRYQDLFLLHPLMPPANGDAGPVVEQRAQSLNASCWDLDWEIEDLVSEDLHKEFRACYPNAITNEVSRSGRTHRDFTRDGKAEFKRFVLREATVDDMVDLVRLVCALRDYVGLGYGHLQP